MRYVSCSFRAAWGLCLAAVLSLAGLGLAHAANDEIPQVHVGATTTITLDANPSTGYAWVFDGDASENADLVTVKDLGSASAPAPSGQRPVLGAPKPQRFSVTGVAAGTATLKFHYTRAGGEPAKSTDVMVEVIAVSE